ncbi:MAG TPA: M14 family zinc carboxypeptidase [Longimicrobiales bacterium]|nr:M14 family zinc carboxypeptidase [Longimicrobiales bacterium]
MAPMLRALRLAVALLLLSTAAFGQQPQDSAYGVQIRAYTTEPFFLTPLVDYLPKSETVPTPLAVLGHIAGAPNVLTYPEDVHAYMRAIEAASDRVRVLSLGESEEGRELIVVVISDAPTIARLDEYRDLLARLADPRRTPPSEAELLIAQAKPVYWATGAIHSPETGSPEMLMELAYRLAVDESEAVRRIRDNLIVMLTPVLEVDGRAKQVDLHMAKRRDPKANVASRLAYWGKYVAHDNNRDNIGLALQLSRHVTRHFLEWNPTVLHDLHESASYLYTSTGRGPYNAWVDPVLISEWYRLAHREVEALTGYGVPGVYTFDFYDGWSPNYLLWTANIRNSIGRFYETQGAGDASNRIVRTSVDRAWHRPNTPLPEVVWSIRNNVNLQQSALLVALGEVAGNRTEYLRSFYLKSQRAVAKARAEGPAGYVFPASDPRPGQQARLLQLLQRHGIEVHRLDAPAATATDTFPPGSMVVRMDQPFSRAADMLLDRQYYNPEDPAPYDDVGWTLAPLYNTRSVRVEDTTLLGTAMTRITEPVRAGGAVADAAGARAFVIANRAENGLAAFRFAHRRLRVLAAEVAFESGGHGYPAGSFIIPARGNPDNLAALLERATAEYGFVARGVADVPAVATHPVVVPRVAVVHTWTTTQNEGWVRIGLDEYGVPYEYISVHDVRDDARLGDRYDVLIFGPATNSALVLLNGLQGEQPLPWQKTALTPNLGRQASSPDMRGGLELTGVLNLSNFVKAGGTLITLQNTSVLPVHFGMTPGVQIRETPSLWARGGVFRSRIVDPASPLGYGFDEELGVYFNTAPVFAIAGGPGAPGGFGAAARPAAAPRSPAEVSTTARRSSRGGLDEPDIVQGRARDLGGDRVEEFRRENPDSTPTPAQAIRDARVVMRFAEQPKDLLISGGLRGGDALANAPALIDVSYGRGHVLLFSFNPFWRSETLGSYPLLFNALLHHGSLGVSGPAAGVAAAAP